VNVNPDANSVSVFNVTTDQPQKISEITVGTEPRSVAIAPSGKAAYVANTVAGTVSVVDLGQLSVTATIPVGVEPIALALTPSGSFLYVADEISNDVSVISTLTNKVLTTIPLGAFGTHPRAIAITNGASTDQAETVYVTMFFGVMRPGHTALDEGQDDQREGHVVAIPVATNTPAPAPIVLAPMLDTGFKSNGSVLPQVHTVNGVGTPAPAPTNPAAATFATGAYPNQLAAIALHPTNGKAYVVSTGASPNGPFAFNVNNQGLVSVFDRAIAAEVTASTPAGSAVFRSAPLNMNQGVLNDTGLTPTLFYTNPVAMAWRPDGSDAWVVAQQSDAIVRVTVDANGIPTNGAPTSKTNAGSAASITHVDLDQASIPGTAPRGIAINPAGTRAYVYCFTSKSIAVIDISTGTAPKIAGAAQTVALPAAGSQKATAQLGAQLFFSGRGRMSNNAWGSCIVCHPDGRTDNVTWMFATGPRQTISLDGSFNHGNPSDHRIFNWSGIADEVQDFEANTRGVFGGEGLIDDDRLFFALGGETNGVDSAEIDQFQQFTGKVTATDFLAANAALPALLGARHDFATATTPDGKVWIFGGRSSGQNLGTLVTQQAALVYDPRANTLVAVNQNGFTPRYGCGAAAVNTPSGPRIYVMGGYVDTNGTAPTTLVEELDPQSGAWRAVGSLPVGVAFFGTTVAGGINAAEASPSVHVVCGNSAADGAPLAPLAQVMTFQANPAGLGTWATATPAGLPALSHCGAATVLRGAASHVFLVGGLDANGTAQRTVFDYAAQTLTAVATPITQLPVALSSFGISGSLSTNQIYVIGGLDAAGIDTSTVLQLTPATNGPVAGALGTPSGAFAVVGNLPQARHGLAVSTPVPVTNFLPSANAGRSQAQDAIALWTALAVRPNVGLGAALPAASVSNGRALFAQAGLTGFSGVSCATCHGGAKWTRSTVDYLGAPSPSALTGSEVIVGVQLARTLTQPQTLFEVGTFTPDAAGGRINEVRFNPADPSQIVPALGANGFNIPSLLSVGATAPYFYSGLAPTLENVIDGSADASADAAPVLGGLDFAKVHQVPDVSTNRKDLVSFLLTIDGETPTFP
jgi:YVTN family beta-propeller protein